MASHQRKNHSATPDAALIPASDENASASQLEPSGYAARHEAPTERLRKLGVRVTPQRLFVLDALERASGHMTAEEIMRWASLRYPALNLATVYRTLDLLTSIGLVEQTDLGGVAAFELAGDAPHHHLACERCGGVIEMDEALLEGLRAGALQVYGFHARPRHLAIFGVCGGCWEAGRSAES